MWKKDDLPTNTYSPEAEATPRPQPSVSTPAPAAPAPRTADAASTQRATIGRSITIRGDVTGNEDLLIQGRVDGSIDLKQHSVTIGGEGEVKASIAGRVVIVEGSVEGNIKSEEQVVLRSSARVQGDITAPRLVLEDGARFRGGVDMGEAPSIDKAASSPSTSSSSSSSQAKKPEESTSASGTSSTAVTSSASDSGSAKDSDKGDGASDSNSAKRKGGSGVVAEATR